MYPARTLLLLILLPLSPLAALTGCTPSDDSDGNNEIVIPDDYTPRQPGDQPNIVVFFTDDQGFADLGIQNQLSDLKTPFIDGIAKAGITASQAYVTAPQCTPSRAGLHTGRYQQKFGVDDNRFTPLPLDVVTIGDRMSALGYTTGMVGKWHLEIDSSSDEWVAEHHPELVGTDYKPDDIPLEDRKPYFPDKRGYKDVYFGYHNEYWTTYTKDGKDREADFLDDTRYRIDAISDAAEKFIDRHYDEPFFLHIAHFAPHVPLVAIEKYLDRFPGDMENRRRYALAMTSAVDDGVGQVLSALARYSLLENTLVIFMSDNGAPLGLEPTDAPINDQEEEWNGSYNTPLIGEKGMLTEGGIRVPFVAQWPGKIASGHTIEQPISSLDIGATALTLAGADDQTLQEMDGVNLMPAFMEEDETYLSERPLFWRFWGQSAVLQGDWKYLSMGEQDEYLFDMSSSAAEESNLIDLYPDKAAELKDQLEEWEEELLRNSEAPNAKEKAWYDYHMGH